MNFSPHPGLALGVLRVCTLAFLMTMTFTPAVKAQEEDQVVLTARPGLCVLKDTATKKCVMGVLLEWRAPTGTYCLHQKGVEEPLKCWQQQSEGAHRQALVASADVMFALHSAPQGPLLAEVPVRVLSLAQRRPERRRRRHAWAPL